MALLAIRLVIDQSMRNQLWIKVVVEEIV